MGIYDASAIKKICDDLERRYKALQSSLSENVGSAWLSGNEKARIAVNKYDVALALEDFKSILSMIKKII